MVKLLIKNGADVDILDNDNATALIRAVEKSKLRNFSILSKHK